LFFCSTRAPAIFAVTCIAASLWWTVCLGAVSAGTGNVTLVLDSPDGSVDETIAGSARFTVSSLPPSDVVLSVNLGLPAVILPGPLPNVNCTVTPKCD
jgi:hypothetical protein